MDNIPYRSFPVTDRSFVAVLKREIHLLAIGLGFSAKKIGEVDIIVAELSSNLVKYTKTGEILVKPATEGSNKGLELISLDNGPGMTDPVRMMTDGVSTGGSLGQGLGAIRRLADTFQLYSVPGWGTIGLVRVFQKPVKTTEAIPKATVQALIVPKPGETACGDGCFYKLTSTSLSVFLGDGLGHGLLAQQAVQQALRTVAQQYDSSPASWLTAVHRTAIGTRGLVATGAVFDFVSRKWKVCGVGNIKTQLSSQQQTKNYLAQNGILGYNLPRVLTDQEMGYEPGQCLVMASDGLQTRWSLARYPYIGRYDPIVLAAALYKEHARQTDDMSVVVARIY
jgi:anti-sigma regulatory factor (Ser/Thr protein kinase)